MKYERIMFLDLSPSPTNSHHAYMKIFLNLAGGRESSKSTMTLVPNISDEGFTPELGMCVQRPFIGKASTASLTETWRLLCPFTHKEIKAGEKTSEHNCR